MPAQSGVMEHAPSATFYGLTLAQLKAKLLSSLEPREQIAQSEQQIKASIVLRENADVVNSEVLLNVVDAAKGDPNYGEISPLDAALAYKTRNQRESGLKRGAASGETTVPLKAAA